MNVAKTPPSHSKFVAFRINNIVFATALPRAPFVRRTFNRLSLQSTCELLRSPLASFARLVSC